MVVVTTGDVSGHRRLIDSIAQLDVVDGHVSRAFHAKYNFTYIA
jgi:hypothetical protein